MRLHTLHATIDFIQSSMPRTGRVCSLGLMMSSEAFRWISHAYNIHHQCNEDQNLAIKGVQTAVFHDGRSDAY